MYSANKGGAQASSTPPGYAPALHQQAPILVYYYGTAFDYVLGSMTILYQLSCSHTYEQLAKTISIFHVDISTTVL